MDNKEKKEGAKDEAQEGAKDKAEDKAEEGAKDEVTRRKIFRRKIFRRKIFEPIEGWSEFNTEQIGALNSINESVKNGQLLKPEEIEVFADNIAEKGSFLGNGTQDRGKIKKHLKAMNIVAERQKDFDKAETTLKAIQETEPTLSKKINDIHEKIGEDLDIVEIAVGDINKIQEQALKHLQNTEEYTKAIQDLKKFKDDNNMGFQIEDLLIFPAIFNAIKNHLNDNNKILEVKEKAIKTYSQINKKQNEILNTLGEAQDLDNSDSAKKLIKTKKHLNDMKVESLYFQLSTLDRLEAEEKDARLVELGRKKLLSFKGLS